MISGVYGFAYQAAGCGRADEAAVPRADNGDRSRPDSSGCSSRSSSGKMAFGLDRSFGTKGREELSTSSRQRCCGLFATMAGAGAVPAAGAARRAESNSKATLLTRGPAANCKVDGAICTTS